MTDLGRVLIAAAERTPRNLAVADGPRRFDYAAWLKTAACVADGLGGLTSAFRIESLHDITEHYPRTLRCWQERLAANRERLEALGYSRRLLRLWEYYFCYCEGGFLERSVGAVQLLLNRETAA